MDTNISMEYLEDLRSLIQVNPESTVSRTVLRAEGVKVVLFAFDAGQELTEHTAAMPVLIHVLDGHLEVTAAERTVSLGPGGVIHLGTRCPHALVATEPTRMVLTMMDARQVAAKEAAYVDIKSTSA